MILTNGVTATKIHYVNFGEIKLATEAFVKCTYATLTMHRTGTVSL
jgi:hypothetical protein